MPQTCVDVDCFPGLFVRISPQCEEMIIYKAAATKGPLYLSDLLVIWIDTKLVGILPANRPPFSSF